MFQGSIKLCECFTRAESVCGDEVWDPHPFKQNKPLRLYADSQFHKLARIFCITLPISVYLFIQETSSFFFFFLF